MSSSGQTSFEEIKLAAPAIRALMGAGYTHLEQLTGIRVSDLKGLHGFGPKSVRQLREALAERGLSFAGE